MFKDVATRSLKTFWQSSIAYLIASLSTQMAGVDVFDPQAMKNVLGGLLIGALAAGLSASWNGVVQPILNKYK
jgi:hypothetical protein